LSSKQLELQDTVSRLEDSKIASAFLVSEMEKLTKSYLELKEVNESLQVGGVQNSLHLPIALNSSCTHFHLFQFLRDQPWLLGSNPILCYCLNLEVWRVEDHSVVVELFTLSSVNVKMFFNMLTTVASY
jgi:hypothetical protein